MPDERPSTGLSPRGQRALQTLATCVNVPAPALVGMFRLIDPPPDLPGLHVVMPRLARVLPWMEVLGAYSAEHYADYADWAVALSAADIKPCSEENIPREEIVKVLRLSR